MLGAKVMARGLITPARPLPVLMVAGTADPVVRWTGEVELLGGFATLQRRMSVPASFGF